MTPLGLAAERVSMHTESDTSAFGVSETDSRGVATDYSANSDTLLALFGGIKGELEIPVFEFSKITARFNIKKVFVRDHEQAWYHRGIRGVAEDIDDLAAYLGAQIAHERCRRVVMLGNSMGAYAAILTGCLLAADEVIAFSPQTCIARYWRWLNLDRRWSRQLGRMYGSRSAIPSYYDLKPVLRERTGRTIYHLYFASADRADRKHAVRMKGLPRVFLHPVRTTGHSMIRVLRDSGALTEILQRTLSTAHER